LDREECSERIRLVDEYSRAITDFNALLESLKLRSSAREPADWSGVEIARLRSEQAWSSLEAHIVEHRCLDLHWSDPAISGDLLRAPAMAAPDVILVADDQRRFVDLNDAAATAFQLPRNEIIGRKVEEFFSDIRGGTVLEAWAGFIADGVQFGVCKLMAQGDTRGFEYRAKANFAPGLHLSVLREVSAPE